VQGDEQEAAGDPNRFIGIVVFEVALLPTCGAVHLVVHTEGHNQYGVVAFSVSRRTNEVGIRNALGATRPAIMRLLLSAGVAPVAVALAAVHDPRAFGFAAVVLVATVLAAMSLPVWRATMADPVDALRQGWYTRSHGRAEEVSLH
jgi:putative ABC transport system permease protein